MSLLNIILPITLHFRLIYYIVLKTSLFAIARGMTKIGAINPPSWRVVSWLGSQKTGRDGGGELGKVRPSPIIGTAMGLKFTGPWVQQLGLWDSGKSEHLQSFSQMVNGKSEHLLKHSFFSQYFSLLVMDVWYQGHRKVTQKLNKSYLNPHPLNINELVERF